MKEALKFPNKCNFCKIDKVERLNNLENFRKILYSDIERCDIIINLFDIIDDTSLMVID